MSSQKTVRITKACCILQRIENQHMSGCCVSIEPTKSVSHHLATRQTVNALMKVALMTVTVKNKHAICD